MWVCAKRYYRLLGFASTSPTLSAGAAEETGSWPLHQIPDCAAVSFCRFPSPNYVFEVLWLLLRVFLILPDWWQLFYHLILTPCSWIEEIIPKRYAVLKQFYIRWKNSFVGQEFLNVTKIWYGSSWIQSSDIFFKPHTHFSNFIKVQVIGECGVNFRTKIILFDWNYLLICCSWIKDRASLAS